MEATQKKVIKQQVVYIPTNDLARAQQFYADVFDFHISSYTTVTDPTGEQWSLFPLTKPNEQGEPTPTGFFFLGLGHSPHLIPSDTGTIPFLPCEDVDKALQTVQTSGGKIIQNKTLERQTSTAENQRVELYHAFFLDTEGNKIGLTQGKVITTLSNRTP